MYININVYGTYWNLLLRNHNSNLCVTLQNNSSVCNQITIGKNTSVLLFLPEDNFFLHVKKCFYS